MTIFWIHKKHAIRTWLYNSSLFIILVFFVGFCAVIPIDSISQASHSPNNYALNTFVVVGALVLFGVTGSVIAVSRIYVLQSALSDIPKRYVPLDNGDMPKSCLRMINENFKKCEKINKLSLKSTKGVNHPGLSSPHEDELPPLLPFEDVVKSIGMRLKWNQKLDGSDMNLPINQSFREQIAYYENMFLSSDKELNREYVELYEELRYSGKLITREKFMRFMELSVMFVKLTRMNVGNEGRDIEEDGRPSTIGNYSGDFSFRDRGSYMSKSYVPSEGYRSGSYVSNLYDSERFNETDLGLERVETFKSIGTTGTTRYN